MIYYVIVNVNEINDIISKEKCYFELNYDNRPKFISLQDAIQQAEIYESNADLPEEYAVMKIAIHDTEIVNFINGYSQRIIFVPLQVISFKDIKK